MLIYNNPKTNGICCEDGMFPMGCALPDDTLHINDSLSNELINFLKFKTGRMFDDNQNPTDDDWFKMTWDLLGNMGLKSSKRKNAKLASFPRVNECNQFL